MENSFIAPVITAIATLLGLYVSVAKIKSGFKKELEEETQKAIEHARESARSDIALIKADIESLSKEINRLEDSFNKDVQHIRETYNSEIRNLGHKIEELREEVRGQHSQLVTLLTKLVSDR